MNINVINIIFGIVYLIVYGYMAIIMLGAGHGTPIFLAPSMPFGLGCVILLLLIWLLNRLESRFIRICFFVLISAHYINTIFWLYLMWNDSYPGTIKMWDYARESFLLIILWYILGQVFIWIRYFLETRRISKELV